MRGKGYGRLAVNVSTPYPSPGFAQKPPFIPARASPAGSESLSASESIPGAGFRGCSRIASTQAEIHFVVVDPDPDSDRDSDQSAAQR